MRTVFHIALLAMLLWPACAEAKRFKAVGAGSLTCKVWTKDRTEDPDGHDAVALAQWVQGFVSGYNLYGPGSGDLTLGMKHAEILSSIDIYCKNHPDAEVGRAAAQFVEDRRNP